MNIIIIEDNDHKFGKINNCVDENAGKHFITRLEDLHAAKEFLMKPEHHVDLMILDLNLPFRKGQTPREGAGIDLLIELLEYETFAMPIKVVALTAFSGLQDRFLEEFSKYDIKPILYSGESSDWETELKNIMALRERAEDASNYLYDYDLAIIAALHDPELTQTFDFFDEKEELFIPGDPSPYYKASLNYNGKMLRVVLGYCHEMGVAATSTLTTKMIQNFKPRLFVMTGICGGVKKSSDIGDVIISEINYEYASGKMVSDEKEFLPAPRQIPVEADILGKLTSFKNAYRFPKETLEVTKKECSVKIGVTATGDSVIADAEFIKKISTDQRKLLGIDMEVYGFYTACRMSRDPRPSFFAAKSVVDLADYRKNKKYQKCCSQASAKLVIEFAKSFLIN